MDTCKICHKELGLLGVYGKNFNYCRRCWYKQQISDAEEEIAYWKEEILKLDKLL